MKARLVVLLGLGGCLEVPPAGGRDAAHDATSAVDALGTPVDGGNSAADATVLAGCPGAIEFSCDGPGFYLYCTIVLDFGPASAECQAAGMHLVYVANASENDCIVDALSGQLQSAWIGLTQAPGAAAPGESWTWLDGTSSYFNWTLGQPDDGSANVEEIGLEDCAVLTSSQWLDVRCTGTSRAYLCESGQ